MKIALVGNQNSGKTTLFNLLTGANQKVGNWAGVTIERKVGIIRSTKHELVDLPGIYSLSPYTLEEEVSRKFVFDEKPDLIINIIDATSIERSLYLTTQLLELDTNVIIAMNMIDILEKKGLTIDVEKLIQELGVEIFQISALKNTGIDKLIDYIKQFKKQKTERLRIFPQNIEDAIGRISLNLQGSHKRFVSVKLLERDIHFAKLASQNTENIAIDIEKAYSLDSEQIIANERYNFIVALRRRTVVKQKKISITDKLDKVFLHKYWGIPIFIAIMCAIYFLAVGLFGGFTIDLIGGGIDSISEAFGDWLGSVGASPWAVSLLIDGIVAGIGAVLCFIPQLVVLFLCISLLETTGYMSRITFMLDRVFKKFGLSGKSLIPFIVGSGCSVPGIMASRTVENLEERKMTIMLTPFVPCSAKLPIIALFAGFFFDKFAGLITVALYFIAIAIILVSAVILKKFFFKGKPSTFVLELPEYKTPSVKYIARDVFDKTLEFVKRAGTIILLASVVIWLLSSFNWRFEYGINIDESILASIGNAFAWLFYPMLGEWSWGASVSAIQGIVAKEQVVSSMTIIAGIAGEVGAGEVFGAGSPFAFFNSASAFAFMVFNLFCAPCIGAISAMKKELNSTKTMFYALGFQTLLAFLLSYIVFGIGTLIGVIF